MNDGIKQVSQQRLGRLCFVKARNPRAPTALQTIRHNFITTHGPILFHYLPKEVRNTTVLTFKTKLDKLISTIPDEPVTTRLPINLSNQQLKRPNQLE